MLSDTYLATLKNYYAQELERGSKHPPSIRPRNEVKRKRKAQKLARRKNRH